MFRCTWLLLAGLLSSGLSAQQPALIGYYAGDGHDLYGREIGKMTHLIWCFLHLQGDSLAPLDKDQEKVIRKMVGFKREHPELKVLLSFGGWGGCETCSEVFGREAGRKRFARDVHALLKRTWTDGIDLDWEYPAVQGPQGHAFKPEDRHHFTLLVRTLREELGDHYEVSFAVGGTQECLEKGFEWDSIMPITDRVHIMSYDLVHGFSKTTGHHTPLFGTAGQATSADAAVRWLQGQRVPKGKIVIGSAFYARIFEVKDGKGNGLFKPSTFKRTIPWSAMDTTITIDKGWKWFRDPQAKAAYAFNAASREFLTGDDVESVKAKAAYVREQGLGGIMFWQLLDDKPKGGLLDAIFTVLRTP
jgi:chitinase